MNRAPDTNGHTAESVRARGGYDAYFTPLAEPAGQSGDVTRPSNPETAQQVTPSDRGGAVVGAQSTPPSGAPSAQAAQSPNPSAPREREASTQQPGATAPMAGRPSGAAFGRESYGGFTDLRSSSDVQTSPEQGTSAARGPGPAAVQTSGPTAAGPTAAPNATPIAGVTPKPAAAAPVSEANAVPGNPASWDQPSAQQNSSYSADTGYGRADASRPQSAGSESTVWTGQPQHAEMRPAPWQTADPTTSYVPDRIGRSDPASRVEILPATLTSMDLLAEITAARRAQLKSTSGMRGALNKVGFSLGLSPAEQRTEDRRGRIRRQLNAPYQIAVISVKGGVGRTTVAAALGSTFSGLRPDRVAAIDANPDFGDLPARTAPQPYGLTLRDLAQAGDLDAFSAVHSFTSINNADLAVLASPWSTESIEALSGREFATAIQTLRRHYNLMVVDCGTGVLDSITQMVLQTSDAIVVVTPPTVGGVKGAVATLNWLNSHGLQHLIASSVVAIVHQQPVKPMVDVEQIEKLFATAQRPTRVVPYDEHLGEGGEIDLRLVDKDTLLAFEELAAGLGDGFPSHPATVDRGGRR